MCIIIKEIDVPEHHIGYKCLRPSIEDGKKYLCSPCFSQRHKIGEWSKAIPCDYADIKDRGFHIFLHLKDAKEYAIPDEVICEVEYTNIISVGVTEFYPVESDINLRESDTIVSGEMKINKIICQKIEIERNVYGYHDFKW